MNEMPSPPPSSFKWLKCLELGYEKNTTATPNNHHPCCFRCGKSQEKLFNCARCQVATYCSKECQIQDWKGTDGSMGHKHTCPNYKRVGHEMTFAVEEDKHDAKTELYGRIRFYICPYAVHQSLTVGKGFLFVQSECTLAEVSLLLPHPSQKEMRSVVVHFLTMGEYDSEVCKDDFELAEVRTMLQEAVDAYDETTNVVVLMRFRCGHVALGIAVLVPDYGICKSLGKEYYQNSTAGALQLNLDDI